MDLSIVIPTLNRATFLQKTLQSIAEQEYNGLRYEVIVVDNGSTDDTRSVCTFFENQVANLVYCYDEEPGQLTGRHKGTELSKAPLISFIDDDVELNPHWLDSVVGLFKANESVSILGGPNLPKYYEYPPSWVNYFWQPTPYGGNMCLPLSLIDIGCNQIEIDPLYIFGLNYSIRKKVLLKLGGFHPDCIPLRLQKYQGDGETGLSLIAKSRNVKTLYHASVFLYHQVPADRLTKAYFEKWYYYNGVCQSFTDIRSAHLPDQPGKNNTGAAPTIKQMVSGTSNILRNVMAKNKTKLPDDILQLQACFSDKYDEGYRFHQFWFKADEAVRKWVLKDDYWNYKLPV